MGIFSSLSRQQKEAVGLLQIGTFLEYFDLMLYVHMAVLLNELFFSKADPHTAALLSAFAFCSTYVLRPFGALIFGYIGDTIGRKPTIVITTMMMAFSCIVMASLPTYAQIGVTASWIITICRIVQGLSTMGEIVGAEIYLTEITEPPIRYPIVASTSVFVSFGSFFALFIATLATTCVFNWRIAFWMGACVAVLGTFARTRLRETPDFLGAKKRKTHVTGNASSNGLENQQQLNKASHLWKERVSKRTIMALFLLQCGWPVSFSFIYIYCSNILKNEFLLTPEQIIKHNMLIGLVQFLSCIVFTLLSIKIYPLFLLKLRVAIVLAVSVCFPGLMGLISNAWQLFFIQSLFIFFALSYIPAGGIFYAHFPVYKRFRMTSMTYAIAQAIMYCIVSFGLVYLTEWFGHYGLWIIIFPTTLGFYWGTLRFEKLEKQVHTPLSTKRDFTDHHKTSPSKTMR
jgi:MFS family permease